MGMQQAPRQEVHFDRTVWVNPRTEALRPDECLCMNCEFMKPGTEDHCKIAGAFFGLCVLTGTAFAMTRCPAFKLRAT